MVVRDELEQELQILCRQHPDIAPALMATALRLAEALDNPRITPTATAFCAKSMIEIMDRIYELMPAEQKRSRLDDLADRRAARLARGARA
jgi:hypothetical protein